MKSFIRINVLLLQVKYDEKRLDIFNVSTLEISASVSVLVFLLLKLFLIVATL